MILRVSPADIGVFEDAVRRFGSRPDAAGEAAGGEAAGGEAAAAFVQAPGTMAFVARDGRDVQGWCWGYLLARPDGAGMLYLHNLEVAADCRRQGIGRALLQAFIEAGVQFGARKMFLVTGQSNTAARRLYESMGAGLATQGPTVNYWFLLPPEPRGLVQTQTPGPEIVGDLFGPAKRKR